MIRATGGRRLAAFGIDYLVLPVPKVLDQGGK